MVVQVIPLIADLRDENKNLSDVYFAEGLSAEGDSGSGHYYWNETSTLPDDGYNVLQVTGVATGRWIRIYSGWNIYTANGSLTGNRTVSLNGYNLAFAGSGASSTFNADGSVTLGSLTGSGTRMVVAGPSGILGTQAIAPGTGTTTRFIEQFTATSGQTTFITANTLLNDFFDIFVNGVRLDSDSYTNSSNQVVLVDGCVTGDIVDIVGFSSLGVATVLPSQSGQAGKFLRTDGTNVYWDFASGATNIYNANGTLTGNRVMTMSGYSLSFNGGNVSIGNTSPLSALHVGDRNVNNSTNPVVLISRNVTSAFISNTHAFSDSSLLLLGTGLAYNSYDARVDIGGSNSIDHYAGFQHGIVVNMTGTVTNIYGLFTNTTISAGAIENNYAVYAYNPTGAGTITNNFGLYVANLSKGSNNYGVYLDVASGANKWNIYANGTADSYFRGRVLADAVSFSLTPTNSPAAGQIAYNGATGALAYLMDNTSVMCNIGQQLFAYVTNDDTVTILKGQPVYLFSAAGNRASVKLAANTGDSTSAKTLGLAAENITPNQRGFIICQGVLDGIDTSTYASGATLYLGATAGTLTSTKPYAPNHLVYIGVVERSNAGNGQIYVRTQNGYELDEIHDVDLISTPPVNNNVLTYITGTNNLWKPRSIPTILGYTPQAEITLTTTGTSGAATFASNTLNIPQYQGALTLTTTGTSGAATLVGNTLNIPQYSGGGGMAIGGSITSATAGSVLFAGTSGVLAQDNTNLFWDNTNKRLGIGTNAPDNPIRANVSENLGKGIYVANTNTGNLARAHIVIENNAGEQGILSIWGTATGLPNKTLFNASKDFLIGTDCNIPSGGTSKFQIFVNGYNFATNPQFTLHATGNLTLNTTTDAGFRLDVNGTARIQSKLSLSAGTTSNAQINLASSSAPTSPNNGDIWFDGSDLKMRIGGVTKTFTLV